MELAIGIIIFLAIMGLMLTFAIASAHATRYDRRNGWRG